MYSFATITEDKVIDIQLCDRATLENLLNWRADAASHDTDMEFPNIDETIIAQIINNYISEHQTTIIDIDIVRYVVNNYVKNNYKIIFDIDILNPPKFFKDIAHCKYRVQK